MRLLRRRSSLVAGRIYEAGVDATWSLLFATALFARAASAAEELPNDPGNARALAIAVVAMVLALFAGVLIAIVHAVRRALNGQANIKWPERGNSDIAGGNSASERIESSCYGGGHDGHDVGHP